jgi:hypothetical protein
MINWPALDRRLDPDMTNEIEASVAPVRELSLRQLGESFVRSQLIEVLDSPDDPFTARVIHRWTIQEFHREWPEPAQQMLRADPAVLDPVPPRLLPWDALPVQPWTPVPRSAIEN